MQRRQQRRRERIIPLGTLGFRVVPADPGKVITGYQPSVNNVDDNWGTEPIYQSIEEQAYMFRQSSLKRQIQHVKTSTRYHYLIDSAIRHPDLRKERPHFQDLKEEFSQQFARPTGFWPVKEKKSVQNMEKFLEEMTILTQMVQSIYVPNWMKFSIAINIGPTDIREFQKSAPRRMKGGRRYQLITYQPHATAFLFVETRGPSDVARTEVLRDLRNTPAHQRRRLQSVEVAPPFAGFSIKLSHGEDPKMIHTASESACLIIIDRDYRENEEKSPSEFFSMALNTQIVKARVLSPAEMVYMNSKLTLNSAERASGVIRLLVFQSAIEKMKVLNNYQKGMLKSKFFPEIYYTEQMNIPSHVFDECSLKVDYDLRWKVVSGIRVTLMYEYEKEFALKCFMENSLMVQFDGDYVHYAGEDGTPPKKWDVNLKSMELTGFPNHLRTFQARKWLVQRICEVNKLDLEKIELYEEPATKKIKRNAIEARKIELKLHTEYQLCKTAHVLKIYQPIPGKWDTSDPLNPGARGFVEITVTRTDLPWYLERIGGPRSDSYAATFKEAQQGVRITRDIVERAAYEPIFRCDWSDELGPKITPRYRLSIVISEAMRYALKEPIRALDQIAREFFPQMALTENEKMSAEEAMFYSIRFFERPVRGTEQVTIGVEGWTPEYVRHFFTKFQQLLQPKVFDGARQPDLLFGIGENFVRNLQQKYDSEVLVDIDKLNNTISLFGQRANEAYEELEKYGENKGEIFIETDIPLSFPITSETLLELVDSRLDELARQLDVGSKLVYKENMWCIQYSGNISTYETLTRSIFDLSTGIYKKKIISRGTVDDRQTTCPVCHCELDVNGDFYRFECGHVTCRPCFNNLVNSKIEEPCVNIPCQVEGCDEILSPVELLNIILGGEHRAKELDVEKMRRLMSRLRDVIVTASNNTMKMCPTADCSGVFIKCPREPQKMSKCASCDHKFCTHCLAADHQGYSCADYERVQIPDQSIAEYLRKTKEKVIKCPNCSILVEKKSGCNHIECHCGIHWCWLCQFSSKKSGECYKHMTEVHGGAHAGGAGGGVEGQWVILNGELQAPRELMENAELQRDLQRIIDAELLNNRHPDRNGHWRPRDRLHHLPPLVIPAPGEPPVFPIFRNGFLSLLPELPADSQDVPERVTIFPIQLFDIYPELLHNIFAQQDIMDQMNVARTNQELGEIIFTMYQRAPRRGHMVEEEEW